MECCSVGLIAEVSTESGKLLYMIDTLYIETAIRDHPRVAHILARYPNARRIDCAHYAEVFNRKGQNFRLQKNNPALILAHKPQQWVLPAPAEYGLNSEHNYYFSHMLNCLYDCRYCFLQGMYRSAHYVLFINYEDFATAIEQTIQQLTTDTGSSQPVWFFSGYDCDSLALEPLSGFIEYFLPVFAAQPNAWLEIRTKSTQIRALLRQPALENVVVAFSFTPTAIAAMLEHKVPSVAKRLQAIQSLQQHGWRIGLRFDPLLLHANYQQHYRELFDSVFQVCDPERLHSVSYGPFRLPQAFFATMQRLYPDEPLLAGPLDRHGPSISYRAELEHELREFCAHELQRYVSPHQLYSCELP